MYILYIILPLVLIIGLLVGIFVFAAKKSRNNNSGNQSNSAGNGNMAGNAKTVVHANKLCPACQTEYDFHNDIDWEEYRREKVRQGTTTYSAGVHEWAYIRGVKICHKCGNEVRFNTKVGVGPKNHFDVHVALEKKWNAPKPSLLKAFFNSDACIDADGKAF